MVAAEFLTAQVLIQYRGHEGADFGEGPVCEGMDTERNFPSCIFWISAQRFQADVLVEISKGFFCLISNSSRLPV